MQMLNKELENCHNRQNKLCNTKICMHDRYMYGKIRSQKSNYIPICFYKETYLILKWFDVARSCICVLDIRNNIGNSQL